MGAPFYDAPFMEHTDLVCVLDGTQAVGDGYRRTGLHQTFESILYQSLALRVEGRGGFVEDEDGRVLQDGTGNADALALSAAEASAAVADVRVEALLRCHDEVVGIGNLGRFFNL